MIDREPNLEMIRGKNVEINFIFARHSEKVSGEIYEERSGISKSPLSDHGKEIAGEFGKGLKKEGIRPLGGYITESERTAETLREIFKNAEPIDQVLRRYLSFPLGFPKDIEEKFQEIFEQEREKLMKDNYPKAKFSELSPTEQEEIAWQASEPALEWLLSLDKGWPEPDKKSIPCQWASLVAYKLNRFINLSERQKNDTKMNLPPSIGHKTQTEPFLVYCLRGLESKDLAGRLKELGGGLHVMESWRLRIKTDDKGEKSVSILFRDKEYEVDLEKLRDLAENGRNILGKEKRKIDEF